MSLERTYRRLLACYPREYRRHYEEEMLGVLLDDAGPRRRPPARDIFELLLGAAAARVRYARVALTGPWWRDAAAAVGLISAVAMLGYAARPVIMTVCVALRTGSGHTLGDLLVWHSVPRLVAWAAVVAAAAAGWRGAAALGWTALGLEVVRALGVHTAPLSGNAFMLSDSWTIVLAILAAATLAVRASRPGAALLGRRRLALFGAAVVLVDGSPSIDYIAYSAGWYRADGVLGGGGWIFIRGANYLEAVLTCVGLLLAGLALLSLLAPVRRRTLALFAPVAATLLVTRVGFRYGVLSSPPEQGFMRAGPQWLGTAAPTWPQFLALTLTPLLVLAVGVVLVQLRERGRPAVHPAEETHHRSPTVR